jgi:hypothetical protein
MPCNQPAHQAHVFCFLNYQEMTSTSTLADNPLLKWPRYAPVAHSVKLELPNHYNRIPVAVIEQHLRQTLESGKTQLRSVKMLDLDGQGPQDTQLLQQLWQAMPDISW